MKKIMLIAAVILTITTANAYTWNPALPLKVVNNTNVALQILTGPNNAEFTVQPNTSAYTTTTGNTGVLVSWAGNFNNRIGTGSFNDPTQIGTMSAQTATFVGGINLGQTWGLTDIGDNDNLVLDGNTSDGKTIYPLHATRVKGVAVVRGADNINALGDVFCLDTGVVGFVNQNEIFRCPANETQVVLANHNYLTNISYWGPDDLKSQVSTICNYPNNCTSGTLNDYPGVYMTGFASVPATVQNPENALFLNIPPK